MNQFDNKQAMQLIASYQSGKMSRREFLHRSGTLVAAGMISVSGISQVLAAEPKKGGHMKVAMAHGSTADTLDPAVIENGLQWVASYGVANTLTELAADGSLVPSLATSWQSSPDAKTWTFKLRNDAEFHNGKTMTVDDVIASLNYHRGEASQSVGKPILESVTEIKADGSETMVVNLSSGNADFPLILMRAHSEFILQKTIVLIGKVAVQGRIKLKTMTLVFELILNVIQTTGKKELPMSIQ